MYIIIYKMSNTTEEKINLGIQDIVAVVSIIDVVSSRGAFKGPELSSVGQLRDKLATFVEQNKPPEKETKNSEQNE